MSLRSKTKWSSFWAIVSLGVVAVAAQQAGCASDQPGIVNTTNTNEGGAGGAGGAINLGEQAFRDLEEDLSASCGACHEIGGPADTPFLGKADADDDAYEAISSWPGIVVKPATSSVLVTWPRVGQHTGGPTNPALEEKLSAWLAIEADAIADVEDGKPVIPPFRPILPGFNAVYLDALGPEYLGMAVTFFAEELTESTLSLTSMQVQPTLKKGISIEHPLFTVFSPGSSEASPDPVDSFSNVSQDIEPGTAQELGPGTVVLSNWISGGKISIAFLSVSSIDPLAIGGGGAMMGGPCDALQSFIDNAQPGLQANCVSCHGGNNATATNAVDMSDLGMDPSQTCGQIKNRVNLATPAQSQIFVTTDPQGGASHPFKFGGNAGNFNNFVSAVSVWIQEEAP